ncbi:dTMP kinase [Aggregatilinea lenta]|uniref:dTMP kinase n=1 Tax=Aggregatilinea lenta TaxID=913108 RepID=UPI000E5A617C|nr:dTMP kinase [Aggregatilinea lenta]
MFITLEGPEGSGKTTQVALLVRDLRERGYAVFHTREPGGTSIGDQIRDVLHDLKNEQMHPHTEILLYAASRAQLVNEEIRPRLAVGEVVICDRYADSTLAYQGYGHGLDLGILRQILTFATGGLQPDLTLYLDITVEEGLRRRHAAAEDGAEWNRMDALSLDFHRRVREGYLRLIAEAPSRWVTIDASAPRDVIQAEIRTAILARLTTSDPLSR